MLDPVPVMCVIRVKYGGTFKLRECQIELTAQKIPNHIGSQDRSKAALGANFGHGMLVLSDNPSVMILLEP